MTAVTFFGGAGEIGGNKILVEDQDTRFFLDFGKSYSAEGSCFGFPYRTYFRITDLNELTEPIPMNQLTRTKDGTPVKRPPQGYVRIHDPLV